MQQRNVPIRHRGFTLIELLVVVSIIALLIAALLPALSAVRASAKNAQATAQLSALEQGLETYRGQSELGGIYPPSASDNRTNRLTIANPLYTGAGVGEVVISGAHLLVHAMIGADLLGVAGFRDLDRDGRWWNDMDADVGGAYELDDTTAEVKQPRYGGAGFVDDKLRQGAKTLQTLQQDEGVIVAWNDPPSQTVTANQLVFTDAWGHPILYYRANAAASRMIGSSDAPGIFWQEDNALFTGSADGLSEVDGWEGLDFGQGKIDGQYHNIYGALAPEPKDDVYGTLGDGTFARFIHNDSVIARNEPVRKDSYLLISAGEDGRYGTEDDVTNWKRN